MHKRIMNAFHLLNSIALKNTNKAGCCYNSVRWFCCGETNLHMNQIFREISFKQDELYWFEKGFDFSNNHTPD